jgi:predicted MFS family arabinose efflux permease
MSKGRQSSSNRIGPASEWRSHGTLLIPSLAGIALVSVLGYATGVMMGPLQREFGWSRAEISTGTMIISFVSVLLSPVVGAAIDRFGPRWVAILGVCAYTALLAWLSTATADIWSWWLRCAVLGVASTIILPTVWTAAINGVFIVNRGKALAVALLGTGVSATFVPSLTNALIERLGWRSAIVALALGAGGLVLVLVLVFFRNKAAAHSGWTPSKTPIAALPGMTVREGLYAPAFFKLMAGVFIFGVSCLALTINAVPVLEARGLDRGAAAGVAGLLGIGSIIGRLGGGFLLDRFDAGKIAAVSALAPVVSITILLALPTSDLTSGLAMLMLGLALGAEVDSCSYLAARHFGMRSFGTLFGTINGSVVFGTGIAPVLTNYVFDVAGSYDPVLWATIPLCAFSSVMFLTLGRYPDFAQPPEAQVERSPAATLGTADLPALGLR